MSIFLSFCRSFLLLLLSTFSCPSSFSPNHHLLLSIISCLSSFVCLLLTVFSCPSSHVHHVLPIFFCPPSRVHLQLLVSILSCPPFCQSSSFPGNFYCPSSPVHHIMFLFSCLFAPVHRHFSCPSSSPSSSLHFLLFIFAYLYSPVQHLHFFLLSFFSCPYPPVRCLFLLSFPVRILLSVFSWWSSPVHLHLLTILTC